MNLPVRALFAGALLLSTTTLAAPAHRHGAAATPSGAPAAPGAPASEDQIVAVVNGQVITRRDVDNRGRLFALSTGLPLNPEIIDRLRPQITRQLIDEKLRMQEIQRRHITVPLQRIADAIDGIEKRNGLPSHALRDRLAADGASMTTLIDQIRVQLGWTGVLQQQLGDRARISAADIKQHQDAYEREAGQPEYQISEIFVPVEDPKNSGDALKFADTIIQQLRAGAPFPIVAAQFSQSQTALDGGSLGWVQADTLDPQVVATANEMPIGAISNPIRVAGGYEIIQLQGRRKIGTEMATILSLRQAFVPFDSPLNPQAPTAQQQQALKEATGLEHDAHSCDDLAAANKRYGEKRPSDPGDVQMSRLNPEMAKVLEGLAPGQPSRPLVSSDGIDIVMVCSRQEKNLAKQSTEEVADQILNDRVELASRQLNRDLQRRAVIDKRSAS